MKALVFFSGGISSFVAAHLSVQKYGSGNVELLFTDTLIEDEDLYRFIEESSHSLGCKLHKISDGRNPWQVFSDFRYVANTRASLCSIELKVKPAKKWVTENAPSDVALIFGIDEFEKHRCPAIQRNWLPYTVQFPLCENIIGYDVRRSILESYGLKRPRLYDIGFSHNNCGGFCVKAGQEHFARLYRAMPDRYKYHADMEQKAIDSGINHSGIIRVTRDGVVGYMTLHEYSKHIEKGLFDEYETLGCGCFE